MSLKLDRVVKRVGADVHIHETTLDLDPGSVNVLLGPTMAGKTSLMRLMAGLDKPSEGRVLENDHNVTGQSVRRRQVAMVYQQFINYPSFTVFENIASPLRRGGVERAEIDRRVREAAGRLRIDDLLDRLPAELSGGQQQRTALARALVRDARLLLLDEPLVNLDYKLREELREDLRALFAKSETMVVYATTEPAEALLLGGNIVIVAEGRVLQSGPTLKVYNNPASTRVGEVFSDPPMNMAAGVVSAGDAMIAGDVRLPLTAHLSGLGEGAYTFGVRANHLSLSRAAAEDIEIQGTVDLAEVSGSETFVHVVHGDTSLVVQEEGVHSLGIGKDIRVYLDPDNLFAFDGGGRLVASPRGAAGRA
jgi:glycerol transport system ATP-binding protein